MHTTETTTAATVKAKNTSLAKFKRSMEAALASAGHSIESKFAEAYDDVEFALANEIAQKTIIDHLNNAYDLRLHPKRFRELLQGERDRRKKPGGEAACKMCGKPLNAKTTSDSIESATTDDIAGVCDVEATA